MKVVLPEDDGPAMEMIRIRSRSAATRSAIWPIRFSWNPSATRMSCDTCPEMQSSLNAPTLVTPIAASQRWCSAGMSPPRRGDAGAGAAPWPFPLPFLGSTFPSSSASPSSCGTSRNPCSRPVDGKSGPIDSAYTSPHETSRTVACRRMRSSRKASSQPRSEPLLRLVRGPELEPDRHVERRELLHRVRDPLGERGAVRRVVAEHVHDLVRAARGAHPHAQPRRDLVRRLEEQEPERVGIDLTALPVTRNERRDLRLRHDRRREGHRLLPEEPRDDDRAVHLGREQVLQPRPGPDPPLLAGDPDGDLLHPRERAAAQEQPDVSRELGELVRERRGDAGRDLRRYPGLVALEIGPALHREPGDRERPVGGHRLAAVATAERGELTEGLARSE